jgi:uncharacterized protein (DUF488 family)
MPTIYTIGTTQKSLERFMTALQQAQIDAVIDVRLRNTSHLAGFAKRDDLAFLLRQGFGMAYEHHPDLAPTAEILDAFRDDGDWDAYIHAYLPLLAARRAEEAGRALLDRYARPCLLCAEPAAARCHRRLLAEYWARHIPDLRIVHLE